MITVGVVLFRRNRLFAELPLPQIFGRLRREALKNLTRYLQSRFEKVTYEDYMRVAAKRYHANHAMSHCHISAAAQQPSMEPAVSSPEKSPQQLSPIARVIPTQALSPVRRASTKRTRELHVTREQLHIALEIFNLHANDLNLLFNSLDLEVQDQVEVRHPSNLWHFRRILGSKMV